MEKKRFFCKERAFLERACVLTTQEWLFKSSRKEKLSGSSLFPFRLKLRVTRCVWGGSVALSMYALETLANTSVDVDANCLAPGASFSASWLGGGEGGAI